MTFLSIGKLFGGGRELEHQNIIQTLYKNEADIFVKTTSERTQACLILIPSLLFLRTNTKGEIGIDLFHLSLSPQQPPL